MDTLSLFVIFAITFFCIAVIHIGIPYVLRNAIAKSVLRQRVRNDKIYLTFDDGPDPTSTPLILDTLKKNGVKATFFVIGEALENTPDILRRIHDEGHSIGSHSQIHTHAWRTLPWTSYGDIRKGMASLEKRGIESNLWRPPYGKASLQTLAYTLFKKKDLVYWTADPQDYDPSQTISTLRDWLNKHAGLGSVILLHDGRRHQEDGENITPAALADFLHHTDIPSTQFAAL